MEQFPVHYSAYLFDLDGVLTPTADLHRSAWADLFGPFLQIRGASPYTDDDYYKLIDGRNRYEAVEAVLASRNLSLPYGNPSEPGGLTTVCGLGNLKDAMFHRALRTHPLEAYPGSLRLLETLRSDKVPIGVVSASRNAKLVLESAGLSDMFGVIIDGLVAGQFHLPGKPAPDTYLEAARRLEVRPSQTALVEDALSGVEAGRAGGFNPVIGVDRGAGRQALLAHGATLVVNDLDELLPWKA